MSSALGEAANTRPARLGRYELITQIGQGGMAEVQLALQRGPAGFEKLVVVKLVHKNLASQKAFVDMLLDEARVAALVKHPNVVDIYDLGVVEGRYFIAMEYLEGEPLLAVLRAGRDGKRLDPLSTARLIADTAEGLDAAHELRSMGGEPIELVHHDVSLGNIVVLYNGQVKLVDFGVAKATMSSAAPTKVQGKFSYMAPEKLNGGAGDRRSDIWSLGCVLWEALTLRRLFKGGNDNDTMQLVLESHIPKPSSVNGDVLADFDPIVMRALERDPAKRYPTAKEMATALEEVLRKQGYGGRNDQIAKYMQATFASHIGARKKLLQEVSSKGRASAAVLEAAFREPDDRSQNPQVRTTGEFGRAFVRPDFPEGTPHDRSYPTASPDEVANFLGGETVIDPSPIVIDDIASGAARTDRAEAIGSKNRRLYMIVGAIAAMLVVVIVTSVIVIAARDDAPPRRDPALAASDPGSANQFFEVDAAPVVNVDAGVIAQATDAAAPSSEDAGVDIVMDPDPLKKKPPPPPPPKLGDLIQDALKKFAAGDNRGALVALGKAKAASPRYAPTYRILGMVHERLGERPAARSAFVKYLNLAPNASDAEAIKKRIDNL